MTHKSQPAVGAPLQNTAPTDAPKPALIYVVGNSNSILKYGFVSRLTEIKNFQVVNRSIGGTPNVLLLNAVACDDLFAADYIIIETCVLDAHYGATGRYPKQSSLEALELFVTEVRTRCKAEIIILAIPTQIALLAPQRHWAEGVYSDVAERFGVPFLNGYKLMRGLIGFPQAKQGHIFLERASRLLREFGMLGRVDGFDQDEYTDERDD